MIFKVLGSAIVEYIDTGVRTTIEPDELEFSQSGDNDRKMGPEIIHEATRHLDNGEITWWASEYPIGVFNNQGENSSGYKIVQNFEISLEHEGEAEGPFDYLHDLDQDAQVSELVDWFKGNFEDPANETPYESREGGYLYIWGGPFDPAEVLSDEFYDIVGETVVTRAADVLYEDNFDWAPISGSPYHGYEQEPEDYSAPFDATDLSLDDLFEAVRSQPLVGMDSDDERQKRSKFSDELSRLKDQITAQRSHAGIGHNKPPEEFQIKPESLGEASSAIDDIQQELAEKTPDTSKIQNRLRLLIATGRWVAKKFDKLVESAVTAAGTELGKWAIRAPVVMAAADWLRAILGF